MSSRGNSEMNRVPNEDTEEPLLRYNTEFRNAPSINGEEKKPAFSMCCLKCCGVFLTILLIVCGVIAVGLGVSLKYINEGAQEMVASKVALVSGSETVKQWASPEAPVYFKVYMFNLTNKDEFLNGSKPNLQQVGPFVYKENKTKFDLVWNADETLLGYNESCTYTLDTNLSKGLDPTKINITTLNIPLLGLLVQFEKLQSFANNINSSVLKLIIDDVVKGFDEALREQFKENLFITRSVEDIVWGYTDPFLKFIADMNLPIAGIPEGGKFSLEEKSGYTGPNMIYTGKGNPDDTARFVMHDGLTGISGWGTPFAGMINGTEAIIFHPGVDRNDKLTLFVSELFRSGYFSYYQDVEEFGVKLYQFRLPVSLLSGNGSDPGFNMNGPDGVLNLTAVYQLNVPVFVSKPHFLDAKDYLVNVTGLKPNREIHDAFLNVEPITGAVLHAAKRLQINIQLQKNLNINEFKTLPSITYLPILWVEEGGQMNSTQADEFKSKVYVPLHAVKGASIGVTSAAGFIAVLSCLLLFVITTYVCEKKIKNRRQEPLSVRFDD